MAIDKNRPVYMIGVAAKLVGIHPQTLRLYEREELVIPQRTAKDTRLYSENDIELLKEIQKMTQEMGLNLAGVRLILEMKSDLSEQESNYEKIKEESEDEIARAKKEMGEMQKEMEKKIEVIKKSFRHDIVLYKKPSLKKGGQD